jgi:hypothetical protein
VPVLNLRAAPALWGPWEATLRPFLLPGNLDRQRRHNAGHSQLFLIHKKRPQLGGKLGPDRLGDFSLSLRPG